VVERRIENKITNEKLQTDAEKIGKF